MKTPILVPTGLSGISTTGSRSNVPAGGINWGSAANVGAIPIPEDGTLSDLTVRLGTALTTGQYVITAMNGGVATALTTTISSAGQNQVNSDNSNTAAVSAGDLLSFQITPTSSPDAQTATQLAVVFTATASGKSVILAYHTATAGATFVGVGTGIDSGTEANVQARAPTAGAITKIYAYRATAPGAGQSVTYTLRVGGANSALACTIADTNTAANAASSVSIAAGDLIDIGVTVSGAPASSIGGIGLTWEPTVDGEAVLFNVNTSGLSNSADRYQPIGGGSGSQATESNAYSIAPVAMDLSDLYSRVRTAPGIGQAVEQTLRVGGVSTSLTTSISGAATTAEDGTNVESVVARDLIDILNHPNTTPTSSTAVTNGLVAVAQTPTGGGMMLLGVG